MQKTRSVLLLVLLIALCSGCISEVKPVLKPAQGMDIGARITDQQKWLDKTISDQKFKREVARPLQANLYQIKEKYSRLKAEGALTPKEIESLNRMLDENSDLIFRAKQGQKGRL